MKLSRRRQYTVNLGNYEFFSFAAEVTLDNFDLGKTSEELAEMNDKEFNAFEEELKTAVLEALEEQLKEEIDEAALAADKKSFIRRELNIGKPSKKKGK